jgi:Uma2 family endonuclease
MPQPDALLRIDERCGGRSKITPDGYLEGPPELVAEVSASSTSIDLHDKMHVYRRHGVKEYVVWRVLEQALDWFVLRGGNYEQVATPSDSIYRSEVFPGLWLDSKALLGGDGKQVLAVLQQGLDSAEHAAFAEQLERSGK